MDTTRPPEFTDRQARAVIVASEALGFEREPYLYAKWYDHALQQDAHDAAAYLRAHDPAALEAALTAPDPVPTWAAVDRIINEGGFTLADARVVIAEAADRGFVAAEEDELLNRVMGEFHQAIGALTFLWDTCSDDLSALLGDVIFIAPLPSTTNGRCRCVTHKYAGPLPDESDGRELLHDW